MSTEKVSVLDEEASTLPAGGFRLQTSGFSPEGSGSEPEPNTQNPIPSSERVCRFPISFQRDGDRWVAGQTCIWDLEPLRLVVCEPSEDAVLKLSWGRVEWLFRNWPLSTEVHSRGLFWHRPLLWEPGELARIELLTGSISGAAIVTRKAGTS